MDNDKSVNTQKELISKELVNDQQNQEVISLRGWIGKVRNLGKLLFFELGNGATSWQVVVKEQAIITKLSKLNSGDLIVVTGILKNKQQRNPEDTASEILLRSFQLVNETTLLPFEIRNDLQLKEDNRYRYRYLDLRRSESRRIIVSKHHLLHFIRNYFYQQKFIEIETPILSQNSPEGAKTFTVQSNIEGKFYTLPQSPQIFKQILMIGGFEKYYQIAKTFRNEDARSNRQLEFLQLDIEVAFPEQAEFLKLIGQMMREILEQVFSVRSERITFQQISFKECLEKYGHDKPDLRNPLVITRFPVSLVQREGLNKDSIARGIFVGEILTSNQLAELTLQLTNQAKQVKFAWVVFSKAGDSVEVIAHDPQAKLEANLTSQLANGSYVVLRGSESLLNPVLAKVRMLLGNRKTDDNRSDYKFVWIVDWPLFEYSVQENKFIALRHPFTMPKAEQVNKLFETECDLSQILTDSYDLVCNGEELASGSLRIYKRDLQERVFELLGFSKEQAEKHFGYFLKALGFAAPPHGGIGIGIERMLTVFLGLKSLKETIAFPKNIDGTCSLTGAPNDL